MSVLEKYLKCICDYFENKARVLMYLHNLDNMTMNGLFKFLTWITNSQKLRKRLNTEKNKRKFVARFFIIDFNENVARLIFEWRYITETLFLSYDT
jgi:hypothetical protein